MRALSLTESVPLTEHVAPSQKHGGPSGPRTLSSLSKLPDLIACVVRVMRTNGYSSTDVLAVGLAVEEAVIAAIAEDGQGNVAVGGHASGGPFARRRFKSWSKKMPRPSPPRSSRNSATDWSILPVVVFWHSRPV
jgi:hypothetical protein